MKRLCVPGQGINILGRLTTALPLVKDFSLHGHALSVGYSLTTTVKRHSFGLDPEFVKNNYPDQVVRAFVLVFALYLAWHPFDW